MPTIARRLASLLRPKTDPSPIVNKPPNTNACPHHRMARILYAVMLTLLITIAIPIVVLRVLTSSFMEDNRMQGFVFDTTESDGEPSMKFVMAALPRMLYQVPTKLALVAAVLSIFLYGAHLGFVGTDWKSGKRTQTYAFRRNIMLLHITNALVILFALVSIYVAHKSASHFRDGYVNFRASVMNDISPEQTYFRYSVGRFDLETWACELKDVKGAAMVQDDYSKQCHIEVAGRDIMIPFMILSWLVAGVSVWGFVGGGRRSPDGERVKTQDVGLELGKMRVSSSSN
ncbi:hypothetical protein ACN47E_006044 [Coniothyrium glycines]